LTQSGAPPDAKRRAAVFRELYSCASPVRAGELQSFDQFESSFNFGDEPLAHIGVPFAVPLKRPREDPGELNAELGAVSTAKYVSPDLFERDTPIRSTLAGGISRSSFDLCGPSLLNVLLTLLQAREQLDRQARSLISVESQCFLEYLPRTFCHDQIVSVDRVSPAVDVQGDPAHGFSLNPARQNASASLQ
jgi:hypothetical protein